MWMLHIGELTIVGAVQTRLHIHNGLLTVTYIHINNIIMPTGATLKSLHSLYCYTAMVMANIMPNSTVILTVKPSPNVPASMVFSSFVITPNISMNMKPT